MFTENEINMAFEARKKRKLKQMYTGDRPKYLKMLRILRKRGMVTISSDRKEYLQQWRDNNKERIKKWNGEYLQRRRIYREQNRIQEYLSKISKKQLLDELSNRE